MPWFTNLLKAKSSALYGPFYHQINKGGLRAILESGKLRASEAAMIAGGSTAVRAHRNHPGSSEGGRPLITFYTNTPPYSSSAPWIAIWYQETDLEVEVTNVEGDTSGHE